MCGGVGYPLIHLWTLELLLPLAVVNNPAYEHECANTSLSSCFQSFWVYAHLKLLGRNLHSQNHVSIAWHYSDIFCSYAVFVNAGQTTQIPFCRLMFTKHNIGFWPTNEIACARGVREREGSDICWDFCVPALAEALCKWPRQASRYLEREFFSLFCRLGNQGWKDIRNLPKDLYPADLYTLRSAQLPGHD